MSPSIQAKAYVLPGCPFCFKFLLFMTEAHLLDQIELVSVDPNGSEIDALKNRIADAMQAKVSFPCVEVEPGVFKTDSDQLIEYYAAKHQLSAETLPVLAFYKAGLFAQYIKLYKENMELKAKA